MASPQSTKHGFIKKVKSFETLELLELFTAGAKEIAPSVNSPWTADRGGITFKNRVGSKQFQLGRSKVKFPRPQSI